MNMRRARALRIAAAAAALGVAVAASAVKPGPDAARDRTRFGFDHPFPKMRKGHAAGAAQAFAKFNAAAGRTWKMRFSPRTGNPISVVGGADAPRYGTPREVGLSFLNAHPDMLGLDPATLTYERQTHGNGHNSVLFRQSYKGLPVEFAAVKVHIAADGSVLGVHSSYEPNITVPTTPSVSAQAAAATAIADARNGAVSGTPTLVILPSETDGLAHLAWKMTVAAPSAKWRYYVDALAGQVLLRYNAEEFVSGTVTGQVYQLDPTGTPNPIAAPFTNQYVYIGGAPFVAGRTQATTDASGFYNDPSDDLPVAMSLQGPYVSVAEFRGTSAHYDNGPGLWTNCSTVASTPNPYQFGVVYSSTLTATSCGLSNVASMIPVFNAFQVGQFADSLNVGGEGGDLTQDDQVTVFDPTAAGLGSYVGCTGSACNPAPTGGVLFNSKNGPEAHGQSLEIILAAKGGSNVGYTVTYSSTLYYSNPAGPGALSSSHEWTSSDTFVPGTIGVTPDCPNGTSVQNCPNLHGEISLFYHLNLMHDFFADGSAGNGNTCPTQQYVQNPGTMGQACYSPGVNSCPSCPGGLYAPLPGPAVAMVHVGPDLVNAFFDPDFDDLFFGDGVAAQPSDAFVDDATVPHHEYTHYIVNKIWPLVNFGQGGTISEANADYFSASSLNDPKIGSYIESSYGSLGYQPLRQLTYTPGSAGGYPQPPTEFVLGQTAWTGEIHSDSPFVSQALWDIREAKGQQCADNLEFQALLLFPESFQELYDAQVLVDSLGAAAGCGGAHAAFTAISSAFGAHIPQAVTQTGEDAYEPNDAFDTATDISTITTVNATIYPIADQDFYTFGAGAGLVTATLKLPLTTYAPATYSGYQMFLYDSDHNQVATVAPPYNGIGTVDGECVDGNSTYSGCTTTTQQISMSYNNPTGQQLFVEVVGGTYSNSPSDVNNQNPYTLTVNFPPTGALAAAIVNASYSNDVIAFSVNVATWTTTQVYHLAYVQLRDQGRNVIPNTITSQAQPSSEVVMNTSANGGGQINGDIQLQPGFFSSYPFAGTIYVEVFAYSVLNSTPISLGLSNAINLTGTGSGSVTAYNNVFNPMKGQQAILKWSVASAGRMTMTVFTVIGERVTTIIDEQVPAGLGSVNWNGRNSAGNYVASGVYIVRVQGPGVDDTEKVVVIK
jgi:Zn-dependent metalloprotease